MVNWLIPYSLGRGYPERRTLCILRLRGYQFTHSWMLLETDEWIARGLRSRGKKWNHPKWSTLKEVEMLTKSCSCFAIDFKQKETGLRPAFAVRFCRIRDKVHEGSANFSKKSYIFFHQMPKWRGNHLELEKQESEMILCWTTADGMAFR